MHALVRNWWMLVVRGAVAILFGLMVAARPGPGLLAIVFLFGAYALVFGAFALGAAVLYHPDRRAELAVEGVVAIVAGVATFARPGMTAMALYATIAVFAIGTGILQIVAAARLRREVDGIGWLMASGVISVLFGVALVARPIAGALVVAWLIAAYGLALGITLIAMGMRLRTVAHHALPPEAPTMRPRTMQPA